MDGYPVHVTLPVQWGDLDALGHVNNTRYFTWFESARIALFERVGLANTGADLTVGPLLATTTCDFLRPLHYPDTVVVGARVSRMGNTSFTMEYAVERTAEPGVVVARGAPQSSLLMCVGTPTTCPLDAIPVSRRPTGVQRPSFRPARLQAPT